jgi:two-component system phosphate regulon sensor histidine kinase PhoR
MAEKRRLIWHLYPSYLLIILISLVAVTWYATVSTRQFFLSQKESDLKARALLLEDQIIEHLEPIDEGRINAFCEEAGSRSSTRITVILPSGKVIGDSESNPLDMDNHADRPEFIGAVTGGSNTSIRYSRTLEINFMYVGIPVRQNDELLAVIRTSLPIDIIEQEISKIQRKILIGGLLIAIFATIVSLIVSRRISKPIVNLRKGAESFVKGDFQYRVPLSSIEEIVGLYDSMKDMAMDLHERINTITQQRNEIETILSSMAEGVIAVDNDERIIRINNAAKTMFGSNSSDAHGRSVKEMIRNTVFQSFVSEILTGKAPLEREMELSYEKESYINGHGTLLRDADGNQIGALIVLNDITRLKKLENIRKDFVANVSHEIKTPLTAIKGFVETLIDGSVKDQHDINRFLDIMGKHVKRLEAIIEDLLELSRIEKEAEAEGVRLMDAGLGDILETAIQLCKPKAREKGIEIELTCDESVIANINPPLLEEAVVNLLDNAIKYSDENSKVTIEVDQNDKEVVIKIIDQGKGIEDEHLPRLFERFYRVDKARSRQLGGTGLGLAIVKHIVQAHGGKVSVKSSPGKGSTFSIHLPKTILN